MDNNLHIIHYINDDCNNKTNTNVRSNTQDSLKRINSNRIAPK